MSRKATLVGIALVALWPVCDAAFGQAKATYPEPEDAPVLLYFAMPAAAPRLDGVLDDACWQSAPVITDLGCIHRGEGLAQKQTYFQMAYGDEAIYVGVRALEPDIDKLKLPEGRDSPIYSGDCIEIYVRPELTELTRYQLVANVLGERWDAWISGQARQDKPDVYWGADAQWRAAGQVGKVAWTMEVRLPYSDFGISCKPGNAVGINLVRLTWTEGREFSAWAHSTYEQKDFRYWPYFVFAQPGVAEMQTVERLVPDYEKRTVCWPTDTGTVRVEGGERREIGHARLTEDELRGLDAVIERLEQGLEHLSVARLELTHLPQRLAAIGQARARLAERVRSERFSAYGLEQFRESVKEAAGDAADLEWDVRCLQLLAVDAEGTQQ